MSKKVGGTFIHKVAMKSNQSPPQEITVILLNIGKGTTTAKNGPPEAESFMSKATSCMLKLLERSIFTKPKDELAIILMGTDESKNSLHEESGGCKNISSATGFLVPTWNLLRLLRNDIQSTDNSSDWLDALRVAIDLIRKVAP